MGNKEQIHQLFSYLKSIDNTDLEIQEEAIENVYLQQQQEPHSLIIKLLIILGGLLTSLFGTAFLLLIGLYDSPFGMIITGLIGISFPIYLSTKVKQIFLDTFLLSTYCIGYCLLGFGISTYFEVFSAVPISFLIISCLVLKYIDNYMITFISVVISVGSVYFLLAELQLSFLYAIFISAITILMTWIFLHEAKIVTSRNSFASKYEPIRSALMISFITLLSTLDYHTNYYYYPEIYSNQLTSILQNPLLISIAIYILLYFVLIRVFNVLDVRDVTKQRLWYALTIFVLLPTSFHPSISGTILILLLCFMTNYKTGFLLSILAFIYFIVRYYYDMDMSLLYKSLVLITSGLLFLILYIVTSKKLTPHEKD